ncbi:MAG TPA: aminopeptidase, partial [Saprospiraceae bacterium]|nr:aminopeptidase [Saprospiraceae bacterium]
MTLQTIESKYAQLLTSYCLELKEGDKLFIKSTTLAESLVAEVYKYALQAGAIIEIDLDFREKNSILLNNGSRQQLEYVSPIFTQAMDKYDAYLAIKAPFNLREDQNIPVEA